MINDCIFSVVCVLRALGLQLPFAFYFSSLINEPINLSLFQGAKVFAFFEVVNIF